MNLADFQGWLNSKGASPALDRDGMPGPRTRAAISQVFSNTKAEAITGSQIAAIALRLGVTSKQVRAVAKVESAGGGFDDKGRPKILFERHKFHGTTGGRWSVCAWSDPDAGGYGEDSWEKLAHAAMKDVQAAFGAASWGKFQVMGYHAHHLGYASPLDLAYSCVGSEAAHYELLVRFIEKNGLKAKMQALSADPAACRPFAKAYNGPAYAKNKYDQKLAAAMA